jgi:hypothetical protein
MPWNICHLDLGYTKKIPKIKKKSSKAKFRGIFVSVG